MLELGIRVRGWGRLGLGESVRVRGSGRGWGYMLGRVRVRGRR